MTAENLKVLAGYKNPSRWKLYEFFELSEPKMSENNNIFNIFVNCSLAVYPNFGAQVKPVTKHLIRVSFINTQILTF